MPPNLLRAQRGLVFPIIIVVIAVAAMAAGIWLSARLGGPSQPPSLQAGTLLTPPKELPAFQLQDQEGRAVNPERLEDQWTLLFFGYTHCPDICPNTMSVLNMAVQALPEPVRKRTQVVLVSVDPERDTTEQLGQYVAYFNPSFLGVRGDREQLDLLTRALGILYVHNAPDEHGNYAVDHSAAVLLLDPKARWTAIFSRLPHDPEAIAADLVALDQNYGE